MKLEQFTTGAPTPIDDSSYPAANHNLDEIGTITTTMKYVNNVSAKTTHIKDRHIDTIYTRVKLNGSHDIKLKVDTGPDTCTLTSTGLQKSQLAVKIKPSNCILNKYGGGTIKNYGSARLKISFLNKSTVANFKIIEAPGNPSLPGCSTTWVQGLLRQDRQICRREMQDQAYWRSKTSHPSTENSTCSHHATLPSWNRQDVSGRHHYSGNRTNRLGQLDCVRLQGNAQRQEVRLCFDPKDLNKNIKREHSYSRTIDEILPRLHNKKYFSVMDTKKGYEHVELDKESSMLCTFNTPFGRYKFNRLPFFTKRHLPEETWWCISRHWKRVRKVW